MMDGGPAPPGARATWNPDRNWIDPVSEWQARAAWAAFWRWWALARAAGRRRSYKKGGSP